MERNATEQEKATAYLVYEFERRAYPLTDAGCVKRIYTNLAVIDVTPQGLLVIEMIPGMTLEKLQAMTEPKLQLAAHWQALAPPDAPEARAA